LARTILITGAAGNIGGKLAAHFKETGQYALRLLDLRAGGDIIAADFAVWDEAWARHFAGVDTVIHLAANPSGRANWSEVMGANIMGTEHVLRAARAAKVRLVIYASSVQTELGYRFAEGPITTEMPPAPLSPYAMSKVFCEALGRGFVEETGISFIAFRIGYFQRGENIPGPWMKIGAFGQTIWLSNRDMLQAMEKAIEVEDVPYAVLNLESDNPGMRVDISETKRILGYAPQDGHEAEITPELIAEDERARAACIEPGTYFDEYFTRIEG
jgi:uronate dehydrogenase